MTAGAFIAATDAEAGQKALRIIETLTQDVEVGKIYMGKVTRLMDFGAFVEIIPGALGLQGKEGLVHISQLDERRVGRVRDVLKEGDELFVKGHPDRQAGAYQPVPQGSNAQHAAKKRAIV